jgi:hypothetical protein
VYHALYIRGDAALTPRDVTVFVRESFGDDSPHSRSFSEMLNTARSPRQFACGAVPQQKKLDWMRFPPTTYAHAAHSVWFVATKFFEYRSLLETNQTFASWNTAVGLVSTARVVPFCSGGSFAVHTSALTRVSVNVLRKMLTSLSAAKATVETEYAERTFARIFSVPVTEAQVSDILGMSESVCDKADSSCAYGELYGCDVNRIHFNS